MDLPTAQSLAENLKDLACKVCTENWLKKHDGLSDPIQDIKSCGDLGLITPELQKRLVQEVLEIKAGN